MIKRNFLTTFLLLFILVGCGNEVDRAINKLGGTKEERQEALDILSTTSEDTMPRLIKSLNNKRKSVAVRKEVIRIIGNESQKLNDKRAVTSLIKALHSENIEIKLAAIKALTQIEDDSSVPSLLKLLDDKNKEVRDTVWNKLEEKSLMKVRKAKQIEGFDNENFKKKSNLLEEAVSYNPENHKIVKELISLYSIKGDKGKSLKIADSLGIFMRDFWVLGPFPENFSFTNLPDIRSDLAKSYAGKIKEIQWIKFNEVPISGEVDFRRNPNTKHRNSTFFAYCYIKSSKSQNVLIKIMSGDSISIWVNKSKLLEKESNEMKERHEHIIKTNLKNGENEFILKASSRRYPQFSVRISNPYHKPIKGLKFNKLEEIK